MIKGNKKLDSRGDLIIPTNKGAKNPKATKKL